MQLGFVIDHSRCIGCHACTVACKAENDVPLGSFRTWVKYVEQGSFPDVRRSFAVLRCNQCSDAPCVTICPVRALVKRPDGIVDVDPAACIGCKACMHGCPYDALYIDEDHGTAEKCHFCAHRLESGLAPACAVVCPTEAIVPGDFHDPTSAVARLRAGGGLTARKTEAGTGPNVFYREASAAALDPLATSAAGGYMWSQRVPGGEVDEVTAGAIETRARTTYDVDHPLHWRGKVAAYLFTKSAAAGLLLVQAVLPPLAPGAGSARLAVALSIAALAFLALTTVLLVADLKRPERFLYVLLRPNLRSWLARGSFLLVAYGVALSAWTALLAARASASLLRPVFVATALLAFLAAAYTGWLFAQARGRVLWMRRGLWLHLGVQALVAGAALAAVGAPWLTDSPTILLRLRWLVGLTLLAHLGFVLAEPYLAPRQREREYARAMHLLTRGPFARRHHLVGIGLGIALPCCLLLVPHPLAAPVAGLAAAIALAVEEALLVRAGQALAIS